MGHGRGVFSTLLTDNAILEDALIWADAPEETVRAVAAACAGLPVAVLERLAHDSVASVRAAVAANPLLSSELRARLGRDPHPSVQRAAGRFTSDLPEWVINNLDTMPLRFARRSPVRPPPRESWLAWSETPRSSPLPWQGTGRRPPTPCEPSPARRTP